MTADLMNFPARTYANRDGTAAFCRARPVGQIAMNRVAQRPGRSYLEPSLGRGLAARIAAASSRTPARIVGSELRA